MNDVVLEWSIPYVMSKKKRVLKAVLFSAMVVLLADAVLFYPVILPAVLLLAAMNFFLFRSWSYEYEYEYVNGDFTISKIFRKSKRKDVFRCDRKEIQYIVKGREQSPTGSCRERSVSDYTSGWEKGQVYSLRVGERLIFIEPKEGFLEEMERYHLLRR